MLCYLGDGDCNFIIFLNYLISIESPAGLKTMAIEFQIPIAVSSHLPEQIVKFLLALIVVIGD